MKTELTKAERLQLIGLMTMAKQHNEKLADIKDSVLQLLAVGNEDEEDAGGWVSDAIYGGDALTADKLLQRLREQQERKAKATP